MKVEEWYRFNVMLNDKDRTKFNGDYGLLENGLIVGVIRNQGEVIYQDTLIGKISDDKVEFLKIPHPFRKAPTKFFSYILGNSKNPMQNIENFGKYQQISRDFEELKPIIGKNISEQILIANRLLLPESYFPEKNNRKSLLNTRSKSILPPMIKTLEEICKLDLDTSLNKIKNRTYDTKRDTILTIV